MEQKFTIVELAQKREEAYIKVMEYLKSMTGGKMDSPETMSPFDRLDMTVAVLEQEIRIRMNEEYEELNLAHAAALLELITIMIDGEKHVVVKSEGQFDSDPQ